LVIGGAKKIPLVDKDIRTLRKHQSVDPKREGKGVGLEGLIHGGKRRETSRKGGGEEENNDEREAYCKKELGGEFLE